MSGCVVLVVIEEEVKYHRNKHTVVKLISGGSL